VIRISVLKCSFRSPNAHLIAPLILPGRSAFPIYIHQSPLQDSTVAHRYETTRIQRDHRAIVISRNHGRRASHGSIVIVFLLDTSRCDAPNVLSIQHYLITGSKKYVSQLLRTPSRHSGRQGQFCFAHSMPPCQIEQQNLDGVQRIHHYRHSRRQYGIFFG
jgi:hypothetical protein